MKLYDSHGFEYVAKRARKPRIHKRRNGAWVRNYEGGRTWDFFEGNIDLVSTRFWYDSTWGWNLYFAPQGCDVKWWSISLRKYDLDTLDRASRANGGFTTEETGVGLMIDAAKYVRRDMERVFKRTGQHFSSNEMVAAVCSFAKCDVKDLPKRVFDILESDEVVR